MLDIKFIKENKEVVAEAVKNKKVTARVDLDELVRLSEERKSLRQQVDSINQQKNEAAKARDITLGARLKTELAVVEAQFQTADKKFLSMMLVLPNIPSPDTPIGPDESGNKVLRQVGEKPQFSFAPKDHHELGVALGIIDTEKAGKVSGPRLSYLKGDLVILQFALIQFCLEFLTNKEALLKIVKEAGLSVSVTEFIPVLPPVFVKTSVQNRMARFLKPDDHYMFPNDDIMLIGSAEHTLGALHMDEAIPEQKLPIRYVGYSTAFRREAGTYGKDTKGILRQHQFDKLEMETFCLPEKSLEEQDFLVAIQEHIMKSLKLPYQVVIVCTGDMGFPDYRQVDIETWMPSQNKYRETHSADLIASFQSRRLNTRVKRSDGKTEPVHMNDATAVSQRPLLAILENYQQEDGSVKIPEVLQKYMMGKTSIKKRE